jgi:thiol-disulfide isomerase/thioredoxin
MRYLSILAVLFLVACMHETQENVMPETPEEVSNIEEKMPENHMEDSKDASASDLAIEAEEEMSVGTYVDYAEGVVGNGETSMLFFYASWCGYCQAKDVLLSEIYSEEAIPNVTTYKVDFDTEEALKAQYGVAMQDTFILIDGEGNVIEEIPGASEEDIRGMIFTN